MSGTDPAGSNPFGVFNPFSPEFKEAERVFHDELPGWKQALAVIASIVGAVLLIVGAFPVFCWVVKALQPDANKEVAKTDAFRVDRLGLGGAPVTEEAKRKGEVEANPLPFKLSDYAYGPEKWGKYFFGNLGVIPPLPDYIVEILIASCPFWPDKKVWETHDLVLIPERINNQDLTVACFGERMLTSKKGSSASIREFPPVHAVTMAVEPAHWVLITKTVAPNTQGEAYEDQERNIFAKSVSYRPPSLREAVICLGFDYIVNGATTYKQDPYQLSTATTALHNGKHLGAGRIGNDGGMVIETLFGFGVMIEGMAAVREL